MSGEELTLVQLAHKYIRHRRLRDDNGNYLLLYFNKRFWKYGSGVWRVCDWESLISDMIRLVNETDEEFCNKSSPGLMNAVLRTIQALVTIDHLEQNTYLNQVKTEDVHFIPMQNGILIVTKTATSLSYELRELTPLFFNTYILPYSYNPNVVNTTFVNYLSQVLGVDECKFLRQWFGYCLIPETRAEKFLLMYGGGGNGKSIVLLVLNLLLGEENVSHVHLQGFYSQATFDASDTVGKLCNTVQEIDKVKNVPTGFLKEYISGERMRANEKFRQAYDFTPTARLVFACNHIPEFLDDSDAFMRRFIILEFKKQFLKKAANKIYKTRGYWLAPDVLSSVFNWALGGLEELINEGWEFYEPLSVQQAQVEYKVTTQPMLQFLQDFVEVFPSGEATADKLYAAYKVFCRDGGFYREDKTTLGRTVRKVFPQAIHSGNKLKRGNDRSYVWFGIRFKKDLPEEKENIQLAQQAQETQETQETERVQVGVGFLGEIEIEESLLPQCEVLSFPIINEAAKPNSLNEDLSNVPFTNVSFEHSVKLVQKELLSDIP